MEEATLRAVASALSGFPARFAPLFGRRAETRQHSGEYLRGLLVQRAERRNVENLAEEVAPTQVRSLQRFVSDSPWLTEPLLDALHAGVAACLTPREPTEAVWVFDESGIPKPGTHSAGVARQYGGRLGKVANCQVGVVLAYVSAKGHALVDSRLYLPKRWSDDPVRCRAAGVPDAVAFQTKGELALTLWQQAQQRGRLRAQWATGDEASGQDPKVRDTLDAAGTWYVLEVPRRETVVLTEVETAVPAWSGRGRHPTKVQLVPGAPVGQLVAEVVAALPAPSATPLVTLGWVGAMRWPVETALQTSKGQLGLDEYEVRGWRGWHHHLTLVLLANLFLLECQQAWGGKTAQTPTPLDPPPALTRPQVAFLLGKLLPRRTWTLADLLGWLQHTQARNQQARHSHTRRRAAFAASRATKPDT